MGLILLRISLKIPIQTCPCERRTHEQGTLHVFAIPTPKQHLSELSRQRPYVEITLPGGPCFSNGLFVYKKRSDGTWLLIGTKTCHRNRYHYIFPPLAIRGCAPIFVPRHAIMRRRTPRMRTLFWGPDGWRLLTNVKEAFMVQQICHTGCLYVMTSTFTVE